MRNGAISRSSYVATLLARRATMSIQVPRLALPPPDRVGVMTDKPREVGLSSAGPVLAFTAAELDHDVLVRFDDGTI